MTSRDQDAQVGWWAAGWIIAILYTNQFAILLKTIDYFKDLDDWVVLLMSFFTLVLYGKLIQIILSKEKL